MGEQKCVLLLHQSSKNADKYRFYGFGKQGQISNLHTSVKGGVKVVFDKYDYEFLKLCGLCRYLPVGLAGRYDAPYFSGSVILNLRKCKPIKIQSDKLSDKLTLAG